MIHNGKSGPTLKLGEKAAKKLGPNDWMLVSRDTGAAIERELHELIGEKSPKEFGIEIFEIMGHRVISTPFIPDGEFWSCAPVEGIKNARTKT